MYLERKRGSLKLIVLCLAIKKTHLSESFRENICKIIHYSDLNLTISYVSYI